MKANLQFSNKDYHRNQKAAHVAEGRLRFQF